MPNDDPSALNPPGPSLPKRDLEARQATPAAPTKRVTAGLVPIPTIRGRTLEVLRDAESRPEDPMMVNEGRVHVAVESRSECVTATMACLALEALRRAGGSRVPPAALNRLLQKLIPELNAEEMMEIEVELYEMFGWVGVRLDPSLAPPPEEEQAEREIQYDPDAPHLSLIQRAIREQFDLEMAYYTGSRGELTHRRITPHIIEAEQYLKAYCHMRLEERVFRLSRIARVRPVGGVEVRRRPSPAKPKSGQTTLFGGEPEES